MLDEDSTSRILSLAEAADSHMVTLKTRIDYEFQVHALKGITRCGRTKDQMCAVNGCASNNVTKI